MDSFKVSLFLEPMSKRILTIIFVLLALGSFQRALAQMENKAVNIGFYLPYFTQPGVKTGMSIPIKYWEQKKTDSIIKQRHWVVSPQLSYFTRPNNSHNFSISAEAGYKMKKKLKAFYHIPAFSLGYLLSLTKTEGSVNLGTGELEHSTETYHYFLPVVHYEFGWQTQKQTAYFLKFYLGRKIGGPSEDSGFFGSEIGFRWFLKN